MKRSRKILTDTVFDCESRLASDSMAQMVLSE